MGGKAVAVVVVVVVDVKLDEVVECPLLDRETPDEGSNLE